VRRGAGGGDPRDERLRNGERGARVSWAMARDGFFLTVIALFRLRRLKPNAGRPYRVIGHAEAAVAEVPEA